MQNYHDLQNTEAANVYLDKVKDNIQAVASNFSGTSFPTKNLQAGMLCYRTDEKKLYQLTNTYPITWESVQSSLTFDTTPTADSTNPVTSNGIYRALKKLPTKEYVDTSGPTIVNNIPIHPIPVNAKYGNALIIFKDDSDVGINTIADVIGPYVKNEIATSNSNIDLSEYAKKSTTLSGYGITDANISDGTITLGENAITPITEHQDLSAYLTSANASNLYLGKYATAYAAAKAESDWKGNRITDTYAKKTDLANYVTSDDVSASLTQYAKKSDLTNYVTSDDVSASLTQYAKKTDLSNYVTSSDVSAALTPYAKKSDLANYVTSSDVSTALTQYAKKTDVPAVTVSGNTISFGSVTIGVD